MRVNAALPHLLETKIKPTDIQTGPHRHLQPMHVSLMSPFATLLWVLKLQAVMERQRRAAPWLLPILTTIRSVTEKPFSNSHVQNFLATGT